jgi:transposase
MAKKLVTDELWEVIEPLLPEEPPKPNGGRPRIDDCATLTDILFVLLISAQTSTDLIVDL